MSFVHVRVALQDGFSESWSPMFAAQALETLRNPSPLEGIPENEYVWALPYSARECAVHGVEGWKQYACVLASCSLRSCLRGS